MPKITNPKAIQNKSRSHNITRTGDNTYTVTSGASGNSYNVHITPNGGSCSCKWAQYRPTGDNRSGCSHVVSVYDFIQEQQGRKVSAWASQEDAQRQHRPSLSIGDGLTLTSRVRS